MLGEPLAWDAKAPVEYADYGLRWTKYLPAGDKVVESDWFVDSDLSGDVELIFDNDAIVENGQATVIWLGGGTEGVTYYVTNVVVTEGGRTLQQTRRIAVSSDRQ